MEGTHPPTTMNTSANHHQVASPGYMPRSRRTHHTYPVLCGAQKRRSGPKVSDDRYLSRGVTYLLRGVLPNSPLWDQAPPAAAWSWLSRYFLSRARSGRSRLLRAAWRPCSRGPGPAGVVLTGWRTGGS